MAEADTGEPVPTNIHPLDTPEVQKVIKTFAPEYLDKLATITKPALSPNPDDLERWEAGEILKRRARMYGESDLSYAVRALYEETFSVNQNPGLRPMRLFKGVAGCTPGGLISHFYSPTIINGVSLESMSAQPVQGKSLKEALDLAKDWRTKRNLVDIATECVEPITSTFGGGLERYSVYYKERMAEDASDIPEELDSIGFRLLKLMSVEPDLRKNITVPELRSLTGFHPESPLSTARFVSFIWKKTGPEVINEDGYYNLNENVQITGLKNLLFLRTQPDLQVIYRFLSPSGFLNK